ncbi:creatininase family protein [Halobacteria archaeon AArc-curdl1]|uniref:Creatininase family protein n=1 Tax=Natronosalvus hydrolyticus TaxID=2979988 RepID=A0AAP2Z7I9_9EURY|nr:creatininase family protein [Halobacteria archaeon AArc-curdl1]
MYLADYTWPELESYFDEKSLAIVPIGSTEQHGVHLPEGTDHIIAEGLAREAATRADYLCTPTINIGVSSHHRQFPGTMWVDAPAFRSYVESLSRNLAYHGVDRIVYVNAHGGNVPHLREVGRRLYEDEVAYAIEWMWDESIPELVTELFEQNGPHAGPKETSMVWYLTENVRAEQLEEAKETGCVDLADVQTHQNGARTFYDAVGNAETGSFGDPSDASKEKGEQLFDAACAQLVELCEWIHSQEFDELMPAGPVSNASAAE